jgi:hypothetical protein
LEPGSSEIDGTWHYKLLQEKNMEQNKDEFIGIKIEPDKKQFLEKAAKKSKVSLSRYIRHIIDQFLSGKH